MEPRTKMIIQKNIFLFLLILLVPCQSYQDFPTICNDKMCICDSFGKVICQCTHDYQELTIRQDGAYKMLTTAVHLDVSGCKRVFFLTDAIKNLQELRSIRVSNVDHLTLSENSLYWAGYSDDKQSIYAGITIKIQNTTISEFPSHSVKGYIDEILINASTVLNVKPFAFSNLIGTKKIELIDSYFPSVEIQAFKKLSLDYFFVNGCRFKILPSRTLSDIEIKQSFRLFNVTVDRIRSSAFMITGSKKIQIENSHIGTIEGDALRIVTKGNVIIRNNVIEQIDSGAFFGIGVQKEITAVSGQLELLFDNNTVTIYEKDSWKVNKSSFELLFKQLRINKLCDCSETTQMLPVLFHESNVLCIIKNSSDIQNFVTLQLYDEENCASNSISKIVVISSVIIVIVIICAVAVIIIFILQQRKKRQVAWVNGIKSKNKPQRKLPVILPDGRTYRETELHVIVEKAQLLTTDL